MALRRHGILAGGIAALALLVAAPAAQAGFTPEDFEVQLEMTPQIEQPQPDCQPQVDGSQLCSADFSFAAVGHQAEGTVKHRSSNLSGKIEVVCDLDMRNRMVMRMPAGFSGAPQIVELNGSGRMSCSWHMDFEGDSSLTGRIDGSMSMSLVDAATSTVHMKAQFTVDVVAGTGSFQDMVGTGTFGQDEQFSMGAPGGGPPSAGPPPGGHSSLASISASAAADGGGMNLKLRRGKPGVRIVSPGKTLKKGSSEALHVVTVPGASCKADAKQGGKRVKLGGVKAKSNGSARFSGALAKKLQSGNWKLGVSCSYRTKSGKGATRASSSVSVS